jgi:hypothetical protein
LNPKRIQAGLDRSVGTERQNNADAKYLKRVLTSPDQRCQRAPLQNGRLRRQQLRDHNGNGNQMHHPARREIGLVVGIERLQNPMGQMIAKVGA